MNIRTSIKTTSAATANKHFMFPLRRDPKLARYDAALKHQRSDNAIIKKRSYLYCEFMNEAAAACNFFRESMKKKHNKNQNKIRNERKEIKRI